MGRGVAFKLADSPSEFRQIERLNYQTFVEEIPQHPPNPSRRLRDARHEKNAYVVAKMGARVAGMLALNMERPFSLDAKLADLDSLVPSEGARLCEIRLLAIAPEFRKGKILLGLMRHVVFYALDNRVDFILISGTTRETPMYLKLGFEAFHPPVGSEGAVFVPMILDVLKPEAQKWKKLDSCRGL